MVARKRKKVLRTVKRKKNSFLYPKPAKPPTFKAAHWGLNPQAAYTADVPDPRRNKEMVGLGAVVSIVYLTQKAGDSDLTEYGDKDGKLYFVGGAYYMTEHGIVD